MIQPLSPLAQAFAAYQLGDLRKAKQLGTEVSRREPNNLQALHLLSMVASVSGDRDGHVDLLRRILAIAPNHPPSLIALANVYRTEGNPGDGAKLAERAVVSAPNYASAYNTLGLCLQADGKHFEASERFRQAIRLNPNEATLFVNLGASLHHLGRWGDALASYQKAENLSPNIPEIYEGIAKIYGVQKRRSEAIKNFEKALSITPNSTTRMLQLADARAMVGETEESLRLVLRALEADPTSAEAHYLHGLRLQEQGKFEEARAAFERSLGLEADQGGAYFGLVTNQRVTERDRPVIDTMQSLINANELPADQLVLLHTALGKAHDDIGEYEKAIQHIDEANRLESSKAGGSRFDPREFGGYTQRIIAEFSAEFFRVRKDWSLDSNLPIFIVGLPRSGTTLTEGILSSHPDVEASGEQVFWTEADRNASVVLLGEEKELSLDLGRSYLETLRRFGPMARFVIDKRPDNFLFVGLIHVLFPSAKIVHCTRDIMDNAASLYITPYRTRPAFTQTREGIVAYIEQYRLLMNHWAKVLPAGAVFNVSYEEMVSNQAAVTRELLNFCGLPWNEGCLRPEENRRSVATPSNWQARQSVYRSSVQRWRHYEPFLGPINHLNTQKSGRHL
jgi:tetratricopeptide (TPR) repeat protein